MNRIFKSLWNRITQTFTAVSEAQHSEGKKSHSEQITGVLLPSLLFFSVPSYAVDIGESYTQDIVFGEQDSGVYEAPLSFKSEDHLNVNFNYLTPRDFVLNDTSLLVNQSSGFHQNLLTLKNFSYEGTFSGDNISITGSHNSDFVQNIYQNGQFVGFGIYVLGQRAYGLQKLNENLLGDPLDSSSGVSITLPSGGTSGEADIDVLSMLVGLSLQNEQELTLKVTGDQSFYAKLIGKGSIRYLGTDKQKDRLTIRDLDYGDIFEGSSAYFLQSEYGGTTIFKDVTVEIESPKALGNTNGLQLINSDVRKDSEIVVLGDIQIDKDSTLGSLTDSPLKVVAENLYLHNPQSLEANVDVSLENGNFYFVSAEGFNRTDIEANSIILKAENNKPSFITYDEDAQISAKTTVIEGGSSLSVSGTDQIKGIVSFGAERNLSNTLTINQTNALTVDNIWTFGSETKFQSADNQAVIIAKGQSTDQQLTIPSDQTEQWDRYQGWLRVTNSTLSLQNSGSSIFNRPNQSVGLSVGHGGFILITDNTTIDRFAWANDAQIGIGGILDLSHFDHTKLTPDDPVLTVHELHLDGEGYIVLDPTDYLSIYDIGTAQSSGSVLDYDDSEHKKVIIKADKIIGDNDRIHLYTRNEAGGFDEYRHHEQTLPLKNVAGDTVAVATWGYNVAKEQETEEGVTHGDIYVGYALNQLKLLGQKKTDQSLIIDLNQAMDDTLSAKVTGEGVIDVIGQQKTVLNIRNSNNDFTGLLNIGEGLTVNAIAGALGKGETALQLGNGSRLVLNKTASSQEQKLNGLTLNGDSHLEISDDVTLNLSLNDPESYINTNSRPTEIGASQLSGEGNLVISSGHLRMMGNISNFFNNFKGNTDIGGESVLTFEETDGNFTLNNISGTGRVNLVTDVINTTISLDDLHDFTGTIAATGNISLLLNNETQVSSNSDLTIANSGSINYKAIIFDGYRKSEQGTADFNIDENLTLSGFDSVTFKDMNGIFATEVGEAALTLKNSVIRRLNVDDIDINSSIDSESTLTYGINFGHSGQINMAQITGEGTLYLNFTQFDTARTRNNSPTTALSITKLNEEFTGTLGFDNAKFEVGENHQGDLNNSIKNIHVGQNSTLILNGMKEMEGDLILSANSTLDFSKDNGYVTSDRSVNVLDMKRHSIHLDSDTENTVVVNVNPSIKISQADISGTLMNAVHDRGDQNIDLILIDNVAADKAHLEDIAGALTPHSEFEPSASITYHEGDTAIADITTGVGITYKQINDHTGYLGLGYGKVTDVAIYDGQVAEFKSTGDDLISAKLTDRNENSVGSVRFLGDGNIKLTNNSNDYSGVTIIDEGAHVTANAGTLGNTSAIKLGSDNSVGELTIAGNQKDVLNIDIVNGSKLSLTGNETTVVASSLTGTGSVALNDSSTLRYTSNNDSTLKISVSTTKDSFFEKDGTGYLEFDKSLNDLNLSVLNGSVGLKDGDHLFTLRFASSGVRSAVTAAVTVPGILTIDQLRGTGGSFNMTNVAFGEGSEELVEGKSGLDIGTAEGQHTLNVSAIPGKGTLEKIKVAQVDTGNVEFSLLGTNIESGGYEYHLEKQTTSTGGSDFFLTSISKGHGGDSGDDQGEEENIRNITTTAGSYIGIAYAAQLFDLSLHDRVGNRDWINPMTGEKQTTSLWMHHTMSHERYRDSTAQLRIRTTSNTTMLGGDFVQFTTGDSGLAYAGLMGGYGNMDTKSRSKITGSHSKAETEAWGVGAYAGWKANSDGQTGPYVDGWVMFTHASSDVTGVDQNTEDVKGQGLSASLETGWGFKVGSVATENGKIANFTVEPHASVTCFGMQYDEIHNDAQDVKFEGENNVRTRLGARAILTQEGNNDFNAFVEANWVHNTQEYGATISGLTVDQAGSRNQGEGRIGVDWRVTDSLSVWGRVGASFGSDNYNEREGSIGVRYQF